MADQRPTVHIRTEGGRYHITISGPNRAYAVQRLREHLPQHGARCWRQSEHCWSTASHRALVAWLAYERGVIVDWPQSDEQSA